MNYRELSKKLTLESDKIKRGIFEADTIVEKYEKMSDVESTAASQYEEEIIKLTRNYLLEHSGGDVKVAADKLTEIFQSVGLNHQFDEQLEIIQDRIIHAKGQLRDLPSEAEAKEAIKEVEQAFKKSEHEEEVLAMKYENFSSLHQLLLTALRLSEAGVNSKEDVQKVMNPGFFRRIFTANKETQRSLSILEEALSDVKKDKTLHSFFKHTHALPEEVLIGRKKLMEEMSRLEENKEAVKSALDDQNLTLNRIVDAQNKVENDTPQNIIGQLVDWGFKDERDPSNNFVVIANKINKHTDISNTLSKYVSTLAKRDMANKIASNLRNTSSKIQSVQDKLEKNSKKADRAGTNSVRKFDEEAFDQQMSDLNRMMNSQIKWAEKRSFPLHNYRYRNTRDNDFFHMNMVNTALLVYLFSDSGANHEGGALLLGEDIQALQDSDTLSAAGLSGDLSELGDLGAGIENIEASTSLLTQDFNVDIASNIGAIGSVDIPSIDSGLSSSSFGGGMDSGSIGGGFDGGGGGF